MGTKIACQSQYLATPQNGWKEIRAIADEDDSDGGLVAAADFALQGYDRDAQSPVDLFNLFGNNFGALVLAFLGGTEGAASAADNDTFGYTVLGWPSDSGPAGNPPHWLCQSTAANNCTLGAMTTTIDPTTGLTISPSETRRFAQTLTLTDNWLGVCDVSDAAGADRIALLRIRDLLGLRYVKVHISGCDGANSAGEAPAIQVIGRVY